MTAADAGSLLLAATLVAGIVSLVASQFDSPRARRVAHGAFLVAWAALAGALVRMAAAFVLGDVSLLYAWEHTRSDYPFHYRMSGLWGGSVGTMLMWAFGLGTVLLAEKRRAFGGLGLHAPEAAGARTRDVHRVVHGVLLALVVAFAAFLLYTNAFAPTPEALRRLPGQWQGRGLQPILLHPLMVIHPPIQFVAYALMAAPAALALGALATGAPPGAWTSPAMRWARWAWLFATIGLGLGALWAYYVLSFGGFWAWDPVETGNLMPWLALTAFLHAGKYAQRFREYPLAAPLLAVATLWLTFFATFVTRSGLWVSVHAFTDPTNRFDPDAASRLLGILEVHPATRFFTGILVALAFVTAALLAAREARATGTRGAHAASRAYAVFAAAVAGVAVASPATVLGAAFEAGTALAAGRTALGTGALALLALGAPPLALYLARPEDADAVKSTGARDWSRRLMYAGVITFTIALVVAFLLNLQVVNGFHRGVFDVRAPFVVAPLLTILTLMLAHTVVGKRRATLLAAGGLALGAAGFALASDAVRVLPVDPVVALAVPVTLATGVAAFLKIGHVNRGAQGPLRAAGLMLLAAGVLGAVQWASPPSRVAVAGITWAPTVPAAVVLFALSAVGILGAVAALRATGPRVALAGAAAAIVPAGYGVGALLALAALGLIARHRSAFSARAFYPAALPGLRQTGIYLIHLAVAIGVMGYAAATYGATEDQYVHLAIGEEAAFTDAGTILLHAPEGDAEHPVVPYTLERDGRTVHGEIAFQYDQPIGRSGHYAQDLRVQRGLAEDAYAAGFGLRFADGTEVATLAPTKVQEPGAITAVTFSLTTFPLMGLVWAGLWLMVLGIVLVVVAATMEKRLAVAGERAASHSRVRETAARPRVGP